MPQCKPDCTSGFASFEQVAVPSEQVLVMQLVMSAQKMHHIKTTVYTPGIWATVISAAFTAQQYTVDLMHRQWRKLNLQLYHRLSISAIWHRLQGQPPVRDWSEHDSAFLAPLFEPLSLYAAHSHHHPCLLFWMPAVALTMLEARHICVICVHIHSHPDVHS